ncbi:hypothetical protein B484DRAFT_168551 [Ochromonadaceae sp. CCMP2298]|nr:hypothetical protein B484DRAFT_168551 [Ochromonadaceae sp. CCMP2298]
MANNKSPRPMYQYQPAAQSMYLPAEPMGGGGRPSRKSSGSMASETSSVTMNSPNSPRRSPGPGPPGPPVAGPGLRAPAQSFYGDPNGGMAPGPPQRGPMGPGPPMGMGGGPRGPGPQGPPPGYGYGPPPPYGAPPQYGNGPPRYGNGPPYGHQYGNGPPYGPPGYGGPMQGGPMGPRNMGQQPIVYRVPARQQPRSADSLMLEQIEEMERIERNRGWSNSRGNPSYSGGGGGGGGGRADDALEVAMLVSQQDAQFGTNMLEEVTSQDRDFVRSLTDQGVREHEALKICFDRKHPEGSRMVSP